MDTSPWAPPRPDARPLLVRPAPRVLVVPEAPTARDERGLVATPWLKGTWLVSQVAVVPAAIIGPSVGLALAAGSVLLLMAWSGAATMNVWRARPRTLYSRPPRPEAAALAWLAPIVVLAAIGALGWWMWDRTAVAAELAGDERRERLAWLAAGFGTLPFLFALYLPHAVLGRATAWVGGSRRRWQHLFWVPAMVTVLAVLVQWLVLLVAAVNASDGALGVAGTGAVAVSIALVALPAVVTWRLAWSAMSELERATRMTWERRNFPAGRLDLTSELATRALTAAYIASHPSS